MSEARRIVADLFQPKAWIFWTDFLACWAVGVVCFTLVRRFPLFGWQQVGLFAVSTLAIYRASLFIHEIVHLRSGTFNGFRLVWNLLFGVPFLLPSFLYYTHLDHHRGHHFGTKHDGEYIPLGTQSPWAILTYLSQCLFVPILAVLRFLVLTPLTWFDSPLRRLIYQHMSAMVMNPQYVRPMPTPQVLKIWRLQEAGCFLTCIVGIVMLVRGLNPDVPPEAFNRPLLNGVLPISMLIQSYLTGMVIVFLNGVRTLGAHRFTNEGAEMTFIEQLLDSVNYPNRPLLGELWAPVGLRFHALHHLFPSLPYHNLDEAHRRLMAQLPENSPYRQTVSSSLPAALSQLWRASVDSNRNRKMRQVLPNRPVQHPTLQMHGDRK